MSSLKLASTLAVLVLGLGASLGVSHSAHAQDPGFFHGKSGKLDFAIDSGKSQFKWVSDAPAEKIFGTADGVSGTFSVGDAANPASTTGTIKVPVARMKTGNPIRDGHLQGSDWLNSKANPDIVFELQRVDGFKATGARGSGTAHGNFTLNGVSKAITVPIDVAYSAEKNLLKVTTRFKISLDDYKIKGKSGIVGNKVGKVIDVECTLYAAGR